MKPDDLKKYIEVFEYVAKLPWFKYVVFIIGIAAITQFLKHIFFKEDTKKKGERPKRFGLLISLIMSAVGVVLTVSLDYFKNVYIPFAIILGLVYWIGSVFAYNIAKFFARIKFFKRIFEKLLGSDKK